MQTVVEYNGEQRNLSSLSLSPLPVRELLHDLRNPNLKLDLHR